ncbi:MAG: iron ABC transporter permease [Vicingus serpentipes]|nr:iron ABC transporter permease [Vicingus serpentipes]
MKDFFSHKIIYIIVLLLIGIILFFGLDLLLGSVHIPFKEVIAILQGKSAEKESWEIIILKSRLPKAIAALLCGAALSVSGLQMQTLFRNPLAGPYILGISSGAGLGVALFIMGISAFGLSLSTFHIIGSYGLIVFSIVGSVGVLLILLAIINRLKDVMTVLILGIMIGSVITAIIGILQYFSGNEQLKSFIVWSMGDLSSVTLSQSFILLFVVGIGLLMAFIISKKLNAYLLGEDYAKSLGVNIKSTRLIIVLTTAILAGSVTAFCGPIGFIGIIVPHMARMLSRSSDHRILTILSILIGVNIMLLADVIAQLPGSEQSLPINSITSLIGIPFIIWIIMKNKSIKNLN